MLPDFIGIGAPRCGTTWIYEMLKQHPHVFMSPEKEINFFNNSFDKGIEWYKKFFLNGSERAIVGEFSPLYLANEIVPQRIKQVLPNVKLIVSLRNPIEQALSRYRYMVMRQMYNKTFEEALKEQLHILNEALYYQHLEQYLKYFEKSQMLILVYEDLEKDPHNFLMNIYDFLGLDNSFMPSNINEKIHITRTPRVKSFERTIVLTRMLLRKLGLSSFAEMVKKTGIVDKIKKLNTADERLSGDVGSDTRTQLNRIFAKDKAKLSELLGRDLSFWK
ncbi:MAG: hypothetical protein A2W05_06500 [Candidatus Schekmanbacteria bacterium RBG_16_38_10]|uniref:Sulfotransferase domain-containing protein n=1 Tax=Candidatus Schekmanbacteria bacterium RBG_16_38_10 TaxID=1817879 RepID=A0A1F7RV00_9BACT|nr:MAG: hypothetical protein A2W05_06500 [Candidatus Schekmanbacteria bacterium RBG_16_38_10]